MRITWTTALAAIVAGCAVEATVYRPLTPSLIQVDGQEAATYAVPPAAPKGDVRVLSFGGEKLSGTGQSALYLHLRLWVHNVSDDQVWIADAGEQVLEYVGRGLVRPSFAGGPHGQARLDVAAGSEAALDLYYLLPPEGDPPRATLWWIVHRGDQTVAESTTFDRVTGRYPEPRSRVGVGFGVGFGPGFWWGPGDFWGYWGPVWGQPYPFWGFEAPLYAVPPAWDRGPRGWPRGYHGPPPPPPSAPGGKSDWRGGHR
jgi:hypothetical protein